MNLYHKIFNIIHHVWNDDQSCKILEGQKLDVLSQLVVKLEFDPDIIGGSIPLCSGFLVTKKNKITIAAGGGGQSISLDFYSVSLYH